MRRKIIRLVRVIGLYRILWTLREFYFRRFGLVLSQVDYHRGSLSARDHSDALRRDGCIILPAYYQGEQLEAFRADAGRLFAQYGELNDRPDTQEIWVHEPFLHSRQLLATAFDPFLCSIITNYFSGPVFLDSVAMYRIEPMAEFRGGSFQWHHDGKGKHLKCMLLLTDVSSQDQRMDYWLGTHKPYRYTSTHVETRFESDPLLLDELSTHRRIVECIGSAGTVVIFDTNGLHSGNRNPSKRRDVLTNVYRTRKPRVQAPVGPGFLDTVPPGILKRVRY